MNKQNFYSIFLILAISFFAQSCRNTEKTPGKFSVSSETYGKLPDSTEVKQFTITNPSGMTVKALNYGGIITQLLVPDKEGKLVDVVLGFDNLQDYLAKSPYFGAIIGRYGNRIAKAQFTLDGNTFKLKANNGPNSLHGGLKGFDKIVWETETFEDSASASLVFKYISPDGEEGFPGNLDVKVKYTLTKNNELIFEYFAQTDKPTPVNLTQHSYFNLEGGGEVKNHLMRIAASRYTVVDSLLIPTGELREVAGTPFDFTGAKPIGQDLAATGGKPVGYDHNFVLDKAEPGNPVIEASSPKSGITMQVFTEQPGVQLYTGNFLDGTLSGKNGNAYKQYSAFVLETQHFPDSPNQPGFPNTILKPGEKYYTKTTFKFSAK